MDFFPTQGDFPPQLERKQTAALATGLGDVGVDVIEDASPHTGDWLYVHALGGDIIFTSVTMKPGRLTGSFAGKTLSNGDRLYGPIIGIQLASGVGVMGRRSNT